MPTTSQRIVIKTTWGDITVALKNRQIHECHLPTLTHNPELAFGILSFQGIDATPEIEPYLDALFSGQPHPVPSFAPPKGTPFQQAVWRGIASIPHGKTCSYGELAAKIGHPKAVRAVGSACGKNPLPLFIPCHRILGSAGKLGGFSAGLPWKNLLLEREHCSNQNFAPTKS